MDRDPLGVVLAGGLSSRMGPDKALLRLSGQTLAERAAGRLAAVCPEVVVADRKRGLVPGLRSVPDIPARGPAAGILGAARSVPGRPLLVLACDLPAVPVALLRALARRGAASGADCVLTRRGTRRAARTGARAGGGIEPLAGYYAPSALAALEEQVAAGRYALWRLFERAELRIEWLEGAELSAFGDPERMFLNLNTPEDLERLLADEGS